MIRRQLHLGTIGVTLAEHAVADPLDLPMTVYPTTPLLLRCWQVRGNLTAYDASYIALAERLGCSLLTADARLSRAPGIRCPIEAV